MGSLAQKTKKLQANMPQSLFAHIPFEIFYHNTTANRQKDLNPYLPLGVSGVSKNPEKKFYI